MPRIKRHPRLEAICGLVAVAIACAFVVSGVVTFALSQLRTPVLHAALASRLTADYGETSASEIAPIDASVILSIARDEAPIMANGKTRFVPIFDSATGSQLPGAAPAATPSIGGGPQAAKTPPGQGDGSQATKTPLPQRAPKATSTPLAPKATSTPLAPKATSTPVAPKATSTPLAPKATSTVLPPKAARTPLPPKATSTPSDPDNQDGQ